MKKSQSLIKKLAIASQQGNLHFCTDVYVSSSVKFLEVNKKLKISLLLEMAVKPRKVKQLAQRCPASEG